MSEVIKVGMADLKTGRDTDVITTLGLGSCIGIALYDPSTKIGGLAHIMLPDSTAFRGEKKVEKFADLAIPSLVEDLKKIGASPRLEAKIAGGASMFKLKNSIAREQIGQRNIAAVKQVLSDLKIPIIGEHTGEDYGRTMWLDLEDLSVTVRTAQREYLDL